MEELPEQTKQALREFKNSVYWAAYSDWVLHESGKCLGQIRISRGNDDYVKGQMSGIEKLSLDLRLDLSETNIEKANEENREYTKELLNKQFNQ